MRQLHQSERVAPTGDSSHIRIGLPCLVSVYQVVACSLFSFAKDGDKR
jgi:hypothetical protein